MEKYTPSNINLTKYIFFTGKGGVGKTTAACATAAQLADSGFNVMLVSTDPASNLQDVFQTELTNKPTPIAEIPNLKVANFDPVEAAEEYKESIVGPYRGVLPDSAVENMAEQLSGSCTVEIASFNEFANFLTDPEVEKDCDYIIFDTAPTGHTLRMLQLPSAWTNFLDENTTGTSCMGQLSGLEESRERYAQAVETLGKGDLTTLLLVTRPQRAAILEASRASKELKELGINNQKLIVNGILEEATDEISQIMYDQQHQDLEEMPADLKAFESFFIPLRPYNVTGVDKLRILLAEEQPEIEVVTNIDRTVPGIETIIADLIAKNTQIIFTMGKGGVGKTSVAIQLATELAKAGKKVHLSTTDPADHLEMYDFDTSNITLSHIDEKQELADYSEEILAQARETMSEEDLEYVKEDLRSPCTQEIAVFRAFAEIVDKTEHGEIVVLDTAPTGHTLLLLESTQSYAMEVERSTGEVPESITKLLPKLQDENYTQVVMVTLAETTPFYESKRLAEDLDRAKIAHKWWLVNQSMIATHTSNKVLQARAASELEWIDRVAEISGGNYAVYQWEPYFEKKMVH